MENEETLKFNRLKRIVDRVCWKIVNGELSLCEAQLLATFTREKAKELIPDMMDRYDLIYKSRLERLIDQFVAKRDI